MLLDLQMTSLDRLQSPQWVLGLDGDDITLNKETTAFYHLFEA